MKKSFFTLVVLILGQFWSSVVPSIGFSSILCNFEKILKNSTNPKKVQKIFLKSQKKIPNIQNNLIFFLFFLLLLLKIKKNHKDKETCKKKLESQKIFLKINFFEKNLKILKIFSFCHKKCYSLGFANRGDQSLARALQSSLIQNPGGYPEH